MSVSASDTGRAKWTREMEWKLKELLGAGKKPREIAGELGLTKQQVYEKMRARGLSVRPKSPAPLVQPLTPPGWRRETLTQRLGIRTMYRRGISLPSVRLLEGEA